MWCALTLAVSAHTFAYSPSFATGTLPKGCVTVNEGASPDREGYANGYTPDGWTVDRFGTRFVAVAPTFTGSDATVKAVLTFPAKPVEAGAVAWWSTRSALPGFAESYTVEAVKPDGTATLLATVDAETAARWAFHSVALDEFAGSEIALRFTAGSTPGFMLMLGELFMGVPESAKFAVENLTGSYAAGNSHTVKLRATNLGPALEGRTLSLLVDGVETETRPIAGWPTLEEREIAFDVPATIGTTTHWIVKIQDGMVLQEGEFHTSHFVRRHIVDKGTGMWCNNCTMGNVRLERLKERLGEEAVITLSTHVNDRLANDPYWSELGFHSLPYFMLDRIRESACDDMAGFDPYYNEPTLFGIWVTSCGLGADKTQALVSVEVKVAPGVDTSGDRYRVGHVLTADFHDPTAGYYQQNDVTTVSGYQYYFLPSRIPGALAFFDDVTLTSGSAFKGAPGTIPEYFPADGGTLDIQLVTPALIPTLAEARLVVFVIDTATGRIMNAAAHRLDRPASVATVDGAAPAAPALESLGAGRFKVSRAGRLEARDIAGRLVAGRHADAGTVELPLGPGLYIVTLDGASAVKTLVK